MRYLLVIYAIIFAVAIHGIVEMSEEIKTNYLTTHPYDLRR